jgi:ATP-dependent Clp protease ATP-binding subunit ClpA
MPTFSRGLEQSLKRTLALANERHHEYATLEHLLLALVDDQDAADVMRGCNVDIDKLRRNMVTYVASELENLITDGAEDSKPTAGFQRVIQRAVIHVQSSGREEVTGAEVLVAIFAERESHAAYFLQEQEMTRYDAVNYISHGIKREPPTPRENTFSPRLPTAEEVPAHESGRSTVLFSTALEDTLRRALADANAREHEYATLVHLLRALIDDVDASAVMKACQIDLDALKADLVGYLDNEIKTLATGDHRDSQPTAGIQRVTSGAVHRVRSLGRGTVTGGDLLLAMFDEKDSPAVWLLERQGMTHQDATNFILHGINKGSGEPAA